MTAKRFTYEYDEYSGNLFDNKMNTFYHIEDSDENIEILCDRLNWLVEENEQLRHDATILIQANQDYRKENGQLKSKFYNIIDERIRVLEHDYNQAVKNGMPSNSVYSEIELLEELKEEMDHI